MLNTKNWDRLQWRALFSRHTGALLQTLCTLRNLISTVIIQLKSLCIPAFSSNVKIIYLLKGPAADATVEPQPWRLIVQPCDEDD
jgi:hypothetical protein